MNFWVALGCLWKQNVEMGRRGKELAIPPDFRLAVTPRMMAGASYLNVMGNYQMPNTSVYGVFHSSCTILSQTYSCPGCRPLYLYYVTQEKSSSCLLILLLRSLVSSALWTV